MKILGLMTCYNRKKKTINSIKKLIEFNPNIDISFVVVDDSSTDGTQEALTEFGNRIVLIEGDGQLYYSGGMRKAIDYAKNKISESYDYVLFFNDDVDFFENSLEKMILFSEKKEIIIGATVNSFGRLSYGGVKKRSKFSPAFDIVMSDEERVYCDTFNANCVLIPFTCFLALDNIDEVYGHSLGDYDYGLAASRRGMKLVVTNFYIGQCENNPRSENWLDNTKPRKERLKLKENTKGLPIKTWFYFLYKNYGLLTAIVYSITPYIRIIIKR